MFFLPERTHWMPSMKLDIASIGIIIATYFTTSSSSLYAWPHKLRAKVIAAPTIRPSVTANTTTTHAAKRAAFGRPAPSSFETRVL